MNEIFCVQCETYKPLSAFNRRGEHILPFGFGNDGKTDAVLKNKICSACNQSFGDAIDKPFLRHVVSRNIERQHNMKRRHPDAALHITGSGAVVRHQTSVAHLLECIKIAFETHVLFLGDEYRDYIFHELRKLLNWFITGHGEMRTALKDWQSYGRTFDEIWAETGQAVLFSKYFDVINRSIFRLDEVTNNPEEIVADIKSRSESGCYASLVQLGCWDFGVAVMICLQSLPPMVVRVCNQRERYIIDYGLDCIYVIDLRSAEKWVGQEYLHPSSEEPNG